jgi:hypothetical protein
MRLSDTVVKRRIVNGILLEMQVAFIKSINEFQATYYNLAEPIIWSEGTKTRLEAISSLDEMVDKLVLKS